MRLRNYLIERNLMNVNEIDDSLNEYIKNHNIRRTDIKKWIKTVFRKYLINDYQFDIYTVTLDNLNHARIWQPFLTKYGTPKWLISALEKGESIYYYALNDILGSGYIDNLNHLMDYFNDNPDVRINRMSVPQAKINADRWIAQRVKKASAEEDWDGIKEVLKVKSYKWVNVFSQQALDREGKLMKHCVGSYYNEVKSNRSIIYSLRDSNNNPHVTVEVKNNKNYADSRK